MTRLTASQGQRLCELVHLFRRDWDLPGIQAAVRKANENAAAMDVARAALNAAANPDAKTPGLIPHPGPHWTGTPTGKQIAHPRCGLHPQHIANRCPDCDAIQPATADQIAAARNRARRLARGETA